MDKYYWEAKFEWKLQDFWVGVFWKRSIGFGGIHVVDLWICLLPCVPLHVTWWYDKPVIPKTKEPIDTFKLSEDGKAITCLRCKLTSHHPQDVKQHYCGRCHVFHDDIWPPARQQWIEGK